MVKHREKVDNNLNLMGVIMSGKYSRCLDIEDIFALVFPWVSEASEATLPVRRPISYTSIVVSFHPVAARARTGLPGSRRRAI
jgi:hypothetical protein